MGQVEQGQVKRWGALLDDERDAAELYSRLALAETGERRQIFEELASIERRHADHWASRLRAAGVDVPAPRRARLRTRLIGATARWLSTSAVLPIVERGERADAGMYDNEPDAAPGMAADERGHARTIAKLIDGAEPSPRQLIARREHWHRSDRSGSLRAAVFGVSDGLVSNTALVMGIAGSGASRTAILLAFVLGAFVVVLPYLIGGGLTALLVAIGLAMLALFTVGAGLGVLNGRSALRSGLRQVLVGGLAAAVTFGVGHLIGAVVS